MLDKRVPVRPVAAAIALFFLAAVLLAGCGPRSVLAEKYAGDRTDTENHTVRIAYYGRIEEAPLFAAVKEGFFENNGIRVDLIRVKEQNPIDEINTGRVDAITADYRFFQYMEDGLRLKLTAGLDAGCIRIIVPKASSVNGIQGLKHLRLGVEAKGDGTMVLTSMLLRSNGMDPVKEVEWVEYGEQGYKTALEKGTADAVCIWEPAEVELPRVNETYRTLYTNVVQHEAAGGGHEHNAGVHFTRTFAGISDKLLREHPEKSVFLAKAWLEGARWVSENKEQAVRLSLEGNYVSGSLEENQRRLSALMWTNGVRAAKPIIRYYIREQKTHGVLQAPDREAFYKQVFQGILPEFY